MTDGEKAMENEEHKFYKAPEIKPPDIIKGVSDFARDVASFHAINKASGFSDMGSCLFIILTFVIAIVGLWAMAYFLVDVNLLDILTGKA